MATAEGEELLRHFDFDVMPVVNPDGYAYTWTEDRFWRKNRNRNEAVRKRTFGQSPEDCYGVDLNRNFPMGFGGTATSDEACSNLYRGQAPFSEPESAAVKKAVEDGDGGTSAAQRYLSYLTVHCYGQYILVPKTYEEGATDSAERDKAVGNKIRELIYKQDQLSKLFGTQLELISCLF